MEEAVVCSEFDVPLKYELSRRIEPRQIWRNMRLTAHTRGLRVIIAGAGGAALPGMVAAYSPLPVIGVPTFPALPE